MSPAGMKVLKVLFVLQKYLASGAVGVGVISQFAKCSRSTTYRELLKAERAGLVKSVEFAYRKSVAYQYQLTEAGFALMDLPF